MAEPFDIQKYRCTGEELGSGSFGVVLGGFVVNNPKIELAFKIIKDTMIWKPENVKYWEQEAKILGLCQITLPLNSLPAAKLSHPNIVHIYHIGEARQAV